MTTKPAPADETATPAELDGKETELYAKVAVGTHPALAPARLPSIN